MEYKLFKDKIVITGKEDFNPTHILECGQVFCYKKEEGCYFVYPGDKSAQIVETKDGYEIRTTTPEFFAKYFDLDTNYSAIKKELNGFKMMNEPIKFGYGIRILKQDLFEMLISFIISSNNNIKRIQLILNNIRSRLGGNFPSQKLLLKQSEEFFKECGAGYRAKYLYNVIRQVSPEKLEEWSALDSTTLRNNLIALSGVGPKVADCVMLFGYGRGDVFPVDTWIHQMYNAHFPHLDNRNQIRDNLVSYFGKLSGYAQQYLFYYQRSVKK